ncbi:MAG: TrmH family RNA methyltransferase [Clostridia bacterium]|nr:TrmH family RNA methyltransferase [Clostridia bacterium]MBQ6721081.1 TrmH family RNA methyltransferase [Clostridia bacterium]MBQ9401441.1 TrmH family RNA methyltransferase [Clostridia bacterium]
MPSLTGYKSDLDYSYAPGIFPAMECLLHRPDRVRRVLVHSSAAGREGVDRLTALAEKIGVRVEEADRALARISGKENCFAAAVFEKFSDALDPEKPHILLHHPGDSGNAGTILRTALGFGVEDAAMIRPCVDPFDPRTVRASMGSLFQLRLRVYDSTEEYLAEAGERDLYPFMLDASVPLAEILKNPVRRRRTLIFGNEGRGLPPEFAKLGQPVRIESNDRIDSLNLGVAAAIGLYAFMQKDQET